LSQGRLLGDLRLPPGRVDRRWIDAESSLVDHKGLSAEDQLQGPQVHGRDFPDQSYVKFFEKKTLPEKADTWQDICIERSQKTGLFPLPHIDDLLRPNDTGSNAGDHLVSRNPNHACETQPPPNLLSESIPRLPRLPPEPFCSRHVQVNMAWP